MRWYEQLQSNILQILSHMQRRGTVADNNDKLKELADLEPEDGVFTAPTAREEAGDAQD